MLIRPLYLFLIDIDPGIHRYGKKSMLWYIFVCSMIGGISVSVTTGLGASIVTTFMGRNQVSSCRFDSEFTTVTSLQFNYWFIYFLIVFVVVTLGASFCFMSLISAIRQPDVCSL